MLSQALEDYLKWIYKLQKDGPVSTNDLARAAGVTAATVSKTTRKLASMGLVVFESYQGVELTEAGEKVALEIIRHHRLLELYLKQVMGYPWERLHDEAEHLEHHISEEFEDRLDALLGFPTRDPHGHPIPSREGVVEVSKAVALAQVEGTGAYIVDHVSDSDPGMLQYMEQLDLLPGSRVVVTAIAPFEGPLTVVAGGETRNIGFRVAQCVYVVPE